MRRIKILNSILIITFFAVSAEKDNFIDDSSDSTDILSMDYSDSLIGISGLSLYWDHELYGPKGRRLEFEFYDVVQHQFDYSLDFRYTITDNTIDIFLVDTLNNGKCPLYARPMGSGKEYTCQSKGGFFITDTSLNIGDYIFNLHTKDFSVKCELKVTDSSYQLIIPSTNYFKSSINYVFPKPIDLLSGAIVFKNNRNIQHANNLKENFLSLGLLETSLPEYPNRRFYVNDDGSPIDKTWLPNNYSYGLVYKTNGISFEKIVSVAKDFYENTELNIFLYSGMGDQASFIQREGIKIFYAGEQ